MLGKDSTRHSLPMDRLVQGNPGQLLDMVQTKVISVHSLFLLLRFFFNYYFFGVIDLTFTASHFYSPSFDFYCFPSSLHSICLIYRSFKGRILNNGCLSSLVVTSL